MRILQAMFSSLLALLFIIIDFAAAHNLTSWNLINTWSTITVVLITIYNTFIQIKTEYIVALMQ